MFTLTKVSRTAAIVAVLSLSASPAAYAAEVLDAHDSTAEPVMVGQIFGPGFFNTASAQTFTAERTGPLSRVVVAAGWFRSPPLGLTATLTHLDASGAPGAAISSISIPAPVKGLAEFMTAPVSFDFTGSGAGLAAGGQYALVVTGASCCAGVALLPGAAYSGGRALSQSDTGVWSEIADADLLFQVYVTTLTQQPPPPPPGPKSKDDCKANGWKAFPAFKNAGQCMALFKG